MTTKEAQQKLRDHFKTNKLFLDRRYTTINLFEKEKYPITAGYSNIWYFKNPKDEDPFLVLKVRDRRHYKRGDFMDESEDIYWGYDPKNPKLENLLNIVIDKIEREEKYQKPSVKESVNWLLGVYKEKDIFYKRRGIRPQPVTDNRPWWQKRIDHWNKLRTEELQLMEAAIDEEQKLTHKQYAENMQGIIDEAVNYWIMNAENKDKNYTFVKDVLKYMDEHNIAYNKK